MSKLFGNCERWRLSMNKIDFIEPTTAAWKRWRKRCREEKRTAIRAVASGKNPKISNLYKGQKDVFRDPHGPFRGKCAYCEQKITSNQHGDIDHFRPKKGVRHLDWTVVTHKVN